MKIAVPTRNGKVDDHFGHCDHYTIYTVENKQIISREELPSPQGCGCKSGIAADLQQMGVEVMLAGSMGAGALNKLQACGIKVVRGCMGDIESVVNGYLLGFVLDSGIGCAGHGEDHECGNHSHEHECAH
ncbi:MAG: NifB/NifX family molybdenum-iron cluster-binding protein [Alistipes sp.]|nr:NifB/NifX family molybdenum-iron cluster-binding protein [Alistipes sp.]MBQ8553297.1 NifB/NifX family molybdenum-iron cluster-binding protein [Alistipes sp.]MBR2073210.1 NifB/NifX family molybdenum-iron cluster-binding protein [Alistipes sp.]MBR3775771.1 NifB/NifX family molybdenum-iron cluster-binding protein [Alistipes sp.]